MKFRPALLTIITLIGASLFYQSAHAERSEARYTVGILASPLMGFRDENNMISGFEAELAQQLCQQMEIQCELTLQPFALNLSQVQANELDFILSSVLITEARKRSVIFSEHYMRSVSAYIGSRIKPLHRAIRVATVKGSVQENYLYQQPRELVTIISVPQVEDAYKALISGEADQVFLPAILQLGFLYGDESYRFDLIGEPVDAPGLSGDVAVAIAPKNAALKARIDHALNILLTNGQYNQLNKKYFPFNLY